MVVRSSARAPRSALVKGLVVAGLRAGQMETKQELPCRAKTAARQTGSLSHAYDDGEHAWQRCGCKVTRTLSLTAFCSGFYDLRGMRRSCGAIRGVSRLLSLVANRAGSRAGRGPTRRAVLPNERPAVFLGATAG